MESNLEKVIADLCLKVNSSLRTYKCVGGVISSANSSESTMTLIIMPIANTVKSGAIDPLTGKDWTLGMHRISDTDSKRLEEKVDYLIKLLTNDGYHTFNELYEHRIGLFIALCKQVHWSDLRTPNTESTVWRSKVNSEGVGEDGWFLLGIGKAAGHQITYHLSMDKWEDCNNIPELEKAPDWDGHTSADVLERLKKYFY